MKIYIHEIGPCYVLTSGQFYIDRYGWKLVEYPRWHPNKTVRISKESKVNKISEK